MTEEQKQLFRDDCLTYYNFAKEDVEGIIASMIYWGQNFTSVKEFTQFILKKTKEFTGIDSETNPYGDKIFKLSEKIIIETLKFYTEEPLEKLNSRFRFKGLTERGVEAIEKQVKAEIFGTLAENKFLKAFGLTTLVNDFIEKAISNIMKDPFGETEIHKHIENAWDETMTVSKVCEKVAAPAVAKLLTAMALPVEAGVVATAIVPAIIATSIGVITMTGYDGISSFYEDPDAFLSISSLETSSQYELKDNGTSFVVDCYTYWYEDPKWVVNAKISDFGKWTGELISNVNYEIYTNEYLASTQAECSGIIVDNNKNQFNILINQFNTNIETTFQSLYDLVKDKSKVNLYLTTESLVVPKHKIGKEYSTKKYIVIDLKEDSRFQEIIKNNRLMEVLQLKENKYLLENEYFKNPLFDGSKLIVQVPINLIDYDNTYEFLELQFFRNINLPSVYSGSDLSEWIVDNGGNYFVQTNIDKGSLEQEFLTILKVNKSDDSIIEGNGGNDIIDGQMGNDIIYGGEGNDSITGGSGVDKLFGQTGDDILIGGTTASISIRSENDILVGGSGDDMLLGGSGVDEYIFDLNENSGNDYIIDSDKRGIIKLVDGDKEIIVRGELRTKENGINYLELGGKEVEGITWKKGRYVNGAYVEEGTNVTLLYMNKQNVVNRITIGNLVKQSGGGIVQEATLGIKYPSIFTSNLHWEDVKIAILQSTSWSGILGAFGMAIAAAMPVRRCDPLILDLDGDGVETSAMAEGTYFDLNGDGSKEKAGWVGQDDGLLVYDRNSDGVIDSGRELFGDQTRLRDGRIAQTGFEALSEFDSNSDGIIDKNDREFKKLKVWQDINSDGISQTEEIKTLEDLGIESINLASETVNKEVNGNIETN